MVKAIHCADPQAGVPGEGHTTAPVGVLGMGSRKSAPPS